jgi:hypothetical protein
MQKICKKNLKIVLKKTIFDTSEINYSEVSNSRQYEFLHNPNCCFKFVIFVRVEYLHQTFAN